MSATLAEIEQEALALPAEDRARLADKLWESISESQAFLLHEAWTDEIERRRMENREGKAAPVPGETVSRKAWEIVKSSADS